MKKLFLLTKLLLTAALFGVGTSAWAQDLPTPVYLLDFEGASAVTDFGGVQHGSGSLLESSDANFGKYYQNWPDVNSTTATNKTNYLEVIPSSNPWETLKSAVTSSGGFTISFWSNGEKGHKASTNSYWSSMFTGYGSTSVQGDTNNPYPFGLDFRYFSAYHSNNGTWSDYDASAYTGENFVWWDQDEKWHHFAYVFSGVGEESAFTLTFYLDGEQKYSQVINAYKRENEEDKPSTGIAMFDGLDRFVIGGATPWNQVDNAFAYDDIALYSLALTSAQLNKIIEHKNATKQTVTIDFSEAMKSMAQRAEVALPLSSNEVNSIGSERMYAINNPTFINLYNYLAASEGSAPTARKQSKPNNTGTDGLYAYNRNYKFSVINLHSGDKIVFDGLSGTIQFRGTNATKLVNNVPTAVASEEAIVAGTTYTITSGTQLDCYIGGENKSGSHYVRAITIISPYDAVSNPSIAETGVEGTAKIVTITNGISSHSNTTVTTYYTINGSEPSISNNAGSFTTATQNVTISSDATVKAISISSDATESYVVALDVEAGAKTPLNTPTATLTDMTATDGLYYPVYTFNSDNSNLPGTPTPDSYTYTFTPTEGEVESGTLTDAKFTFTKRGTVKVVAAITSESFESSEAKSVTVSSHYLRTQYIDVANFYSVTERFQSGLSYDYIANVVFSRKSDTEGCNFRKDEMAYYGRNSSFTATISGLTDEMLVLCENHDKTNKYIATRTNNVVTIPTNNTLKYYSLFALPTVTKSLALGEVGLATYTSDMSLDYSTVSASLIPYKATINGTTVTLTKATVVPAGEGVLLRSVNGGEVKDVAVPVASYSAWAAADNAFVGTIKDITVYQTEGNTTNYVLSKEGEAVGFFKASSVGTSVGANKAYLPVTTTSGARLAVVFEDEATGIADVNAREGEKSSDIYTLSGMRVAAPQKGLYIMNGKKVIIK